MNERVTEYKVDRCDEDERCVKVEVDVLALHFTPAQAFMVGNRMRWLAEQMQNGWLK